MSEDIGSKIEQLERAIAAQEGLRGALDDAIVETTIAALRKQLDELKPLAKAEQQRKLMTVLFVDVAGSTELLSGLDPEENLAIMDAALHQLAEPVERLGGRVLRFMGDGYLAVFGLPQARENDPEMAVRAGLEVLETARAIAGRLEREHNLDRFQVRVGLNTGLVVAGGITEGEATIMGPAVNLAARLESSAPPGGLLVSQHTHQHVRGLFDYEPVEAIQAKGFPEPVQAYLVERARPRAFRLETRGVEGIETPMIGREAELSSLQEAFRGVDQGQGGKFVTVIGEAGLGKSRLLAEFETWLEGQATGCELLKSRASLETQEMPYGLLRNLIAQRVGILDDDSGPEVRKKIVGAFQGAVGEVPNLERNAHFVGQLLGYDFRDSPHLRGVLEDPRQIHDRALVYLVEYLKALSTDRPLAIFLDDVHWADGSSLDAFFHLFHELSGQQVLVIALTRTSLFERRPSWGDGERYQQLALRPLSNQESQQLVGEVLQKVKDLPGRLRDLIIENAEGNPFYLEEMIRMLVENGVIVKSDPAWRVQADRLGEVRIPPTLTGVIQARLDSLPAKEHRVLQQASVIGRVFWDEAVCYIDKDVTPEGMNGLMESAEIKRNLGTLQAREMIFEQGTSAFSGAREYLFKHAVLREVTYESVLKRMRRVYHGLVADWLIAHGDKAGNVTGLIAGHLEKAEKVADALEYLGQAAEFAASNYAIDEALDFYTRALALTSEKDLVRRYTLLRGRMNVFKLQGDRAAQRGDLEELTSIAGNLEDDRKRVAISLDWAWLFYWLGDFPEMIVAARRALDLAEVAELDDLAGPAHNALAWARHQMGEHESAHTQAKIALDLARKTDSRPEEKNALVAVSTVNSALGNYTAARSYSEQALALARDSGDPAQEAAALNNLGVPLTLLGHFESARDMYQQLVDISRDIGYVVSETTGMINLSWVKSAQGKWAETVDYAQAGVKLARKIRNDEALAECLTWLGHGWLGLGKPEQAKVAYQESLQLRRALEQPNLAMGALAGLARAALSQGDPTLALKGVEEILSFLEGGGSLNGTWEPARIYLVCFQVLEEAGDERAEEILEEAYTFLKGRAALIANEDDRRSYLENVPWHREILATREMRRR
jgi:predicted ATPase/class 3 adenylate cyclase